MKRVHIINSRTEAFQRDAVLQENILFKLRKETPEKSGNVVISTGSLDNPSVVEVPLSQIVFPADDEQVIHLPVNRESDQVIASFFVDLPTTLHDLGLEISTGPIVAFRLWNFLTDKLELDCVPLLYPHSLRHAEILPPLNNSADYEDKRIAKKPVAIRVCAQTRPWLLGTHRFILVKRFTSKEERRRLVTAVLDPRNFKHDQLGLENHLNFIHRNRSDVPPFLARGVSRFLNSTHADRFFRQFSGHTQVNAADIRNFRFPPRESLETLGRLKINDADQHILDTIMEKHLGAPNLKDAHL